MLCISPQITYGKEEFQHGIKELSGNKFFAIEPEYGEMIPPASYRRMSKLTRMGVGTALPLLKKHTDISGIILATADGGVTDSIKFLNQIEQYNEGTLTPTNFVQSTPNSLAGILSVLTSNNGYNNTHVHDYLSFENALIDAYMFLGENGGSVIAGAAEEISEWNFNLKFQRGFYKNEDINSSELFSSNTNGTVCGEGAAMFVLSSSNNNAIAKINDISQTSSENEPDKNEMILSLLERNNLSPENIDAVVSGINGDVRTDIFYKNLCNTIFKHSDVYTYRNIFGDFPTSSSLALWMAVNLCNNKEIPTDCIFRKNNKIIKRVLIYNHSLNNQQGAILATKTE